MATKEAPAVAPEAQVSQPIRREIIDLLHEVATTQLMTAVSERYAFRGHSSGDEEEARLLALADTVGMLDEAQLHIAAREIGTASIELTQPFVAWLEEIRSDFESMLREHEGTTEEADLGETAREALVVQAAGRLIDEAQERQR